MENPGMLLRRARQQRGFRGAKHPPAPPVSPPQTPPVHRSSHAGYTALMRSHDRMRTRHISGQGGAGAAYNGSMSFKGGMNDDAK